MKPIVRWGSVAGAITAILILSATLGADLIPWPAKADVIELAEGLTATINGQKELNKRLIRSDRRYWRDIEREAEAELRQYPDSTSAKRELKRAQDSLADIDKELDLK